MPDVLFHTRIDAEEEVCMLYKRHDLTHVVRMLHFWKVELILARRNDMLSEFVIV